MSNTVYRRKGSKSWHYSVTVPDRERIRRSARTPIKSKAQKLADAVEDKEWKRRTTGDGETLTFAEAVMLYKADGRPTQYLKPLVKHFRNQPVGTIKPGDIKAAARALYPDATAATWNRQVITPARAIINYAAERGMGHSIKVTRFHELRTVRKAPPADWLQAFMDAAPPRIAALALFMRVTAARVGQATALEWGKVDLADATATIPAAKGHPERRAFLTPELVAALANIEGERKGLVFGLADRWRARDAWNAVVRAAGIEQVGTHSAGRRAFATAMARAGVDPKTAADLGGWKSLRIMFEIYVDSAASRDVVNSVFSGSLASQSPVTCLADSAKRIKKST